MILPAPVSISDKAYRELQKLRREKNLGDDFGLRIGVKGGGCAGMSYLLGFDLVRENDNTYKFRDFTLIMDKAHGMYLTGMEIDFVEGLNNRGFTFNTPKSPGKSTDK